MNTPKVNYMNGSKHYNPDLSVESAITSSRMTPVSSLYEGFSADNELSITNSAEDKNYKYLWYENEETGFEPVLYLGYDNKLNKDFIELQDGQQLKVTIKDRTYVNPKCLLGVDDLLTMNQFDIGPLLHTVRTRYYRSEIYTAVGPPILISVNPYTNLPSLYSEETQEIYQSVIPSLPSLKIKFTPKIDVVAERNSHDFDDFNLKPHIYRIAQNCLKQMYECQYNQSIIISGESGAGKTEATKKILAYLASTSKKYTANWTGKKQRVFADMTNKLTNSNHLLECFGNAKTIRNDNSSRFGKFTQVYFSNETPNLIGATVTNYLLEKSRIVGQQQDERNYHIFYQLCYGSNLIEPALRSQLFLDSPETFNFTKACTTIYGVDDVEQFKLLLKCFDQLKFLSDGKASILKILAGILHMGNVVIPEADKNTDILDSLGNRKSFEIACDLFGVNPEELCDLIQFKHITDAQNNEEIKVPRNKVDIESARDAIIKAIYEKLFQWIIIELNKELAKVFISESPTNGKTKPPKSSRGGITVGGDSSAFPERFTPWNRKSRVAQVSNPRNEQGTIIDNKSSIGLLDIFGFEVFEINSFEQLCINFANEQLQQQFNLHVFQEEQHLYSLEGIDWTVIPFVDNQEIIAALTDRINGVFPMLDCESLVPKSTDLTLLGKIYSVARDSDNKILIKPNSIIKRSNQFGINHYAGPVYYSALGFLEKNSDRVFPNVMNYLKTAKNCVLSEIFSQPDLSDKPSAAFGRPGFIKTSVSATFRDQLDDLIKTLEITTTSYIRCIKPNSYKASLSFNSMDVLRQLKCAGVLESIRIRKSGYPIRVNIIDFYKRFRSIIESLFPSSDNQLLKPLSKVRDLISYFMCNITDAFARHQNIEIKEYKYYWQLGKSRIFLKTQLQQYIDSRLMQLWNVSATKIQKHIRGFLCRKYYRQIIYYACVLQGINQCQRMAKGFSEYMKARNCAARQIQYFWRIYINRKLLRSVNLISDAWKKYKLKNTQKTSISVSMNSTEDTLSLTYKHTDNEMCTPVITVPSLDTQSVNPNIFNKDLRPYVKQFSNMKKDMLNTETIHKISVKKIERDITPNYPVDNTELSKINTSHQLSYIRKFNKLPVSNEKRSENNKSHKILEIKNFDKIQSIEQPKKTSRDTYRLRNEVIYSDKPHNNYPKIPLNRLTENFSSSSEEFTVKRETAYTDDKTYNSEQLYDYDDYENEDHSRNTPHENRRRCDKDIRRRPPTVPKLRIKPDNITHRPSYGDNFQNRSYNTFASDDMYYEDSNHGTKSVYYFNTKEEEELYLQNEVLRKKIERLYDVINEHVKQLKSQEATILGLSAALSKVIEKKVCKCKQSELYYDINGNTPQTSRMRKDYIMEPCDNMRMRQNTHRSKHRDYMCGMHTTRK